VEVVRGTLRLNCARLSAVMAGARGTGTGGEPLSCTAEGEVVVRDGESKAIAERAHYDCLTEQLTLSGVKRPVIYHQADAVAAESFVLHRRREMFEARGRTSAVIVPREKAPDEAVPTPPGRDEKSVPSLKGKTRVDCSGGAIYEERRNLLFMRDDVLVRQEGYEMSCDRAWALFRPREKKGAGGEEGQPAVAEEKPPTPRLAGIADAPQATGAGPGQLMQVIAAGHVRVRSATRSAEAELVSYDAAARTLTLSGGEPGPVIREGDSWLTAPLIVYHLDGDRIESPNGPFKAVVRSKDLKR
jgi:lipopolysaccharide export system protein LptA